MRLSCLAWGALVLLAHACRGSTPAVPDASAAPAPDVPPGPHSYERADVHAHLDAPNLPIAFKIYGQAGVGRAVNLSGGPPGKVLAENLDAARAYGHRLLTCTNPDWHHLREPDPGALLAADLERGVAMGAVCLKISKALGLGVHVPGEDHLLAVDDPRLAPLWESAGRLGVPVFIHVGDPAAFWRPVTPANERYDELKVHPAWSFADPSYPSRAALLLQFEHLLERHRGTTFVGVHFGNDPEDVDATDARLRAHPNLVVDTAARVPEIGRQPPEHLRALFLRHQDRILFGTDLGVTGGGVMLGSSDGTEPQWSDAQRFFDLHWRFFEGAEASLPHPTPIQGRWQVHALHLPPPVLRKLYLDNAVKLLKWPALVPPAPGVVLPTP